MMQVPSTPEVTAFVARLLKRTRRNLVDWVDSKGGLDADIGQGYSVRLQQVEDFEGSSEAPDHVLILLKDSKAVFTVDRRVILGEELERVLQEETSSYAVFVELWNRALLKSRNVTDHLNVVNSLLTDDDEVPF